MDLKEAQEAQGLWRGNRVLWAAAGVLIVGLVAFALYAAIANISRSSAVEEDSSPAQVEPIGTSGLSRIVLTKRAVERLGIATAPVKPAAGHRETVPYSAVVYDTDGAAWAYINPEPLTYVRHRLVIDRITGDTAVLSAGPRAGTPVVTVGASELFGAESEFDEG